MRSWDIFCSKQFALQKGQKNIKGRVHFSTLGCLCAKALPCNSAWGLILTAHPNPDPFATFSSHVCWYSCSLLTTQPLTSASLDETWSFSPQVSRYSCSHELIQRTHVSNNRNSVNHGIYQQFTRHSSFAIQCKFIQHKFQGGARILTRKSPRPPTICDPALSSHLPGSWGKHKLGICYISHTHHTMKKIDG